MASNLARERLARIKELEAVIDDLNHENAGLQRKVEIAREEAVQSKADAVSYKRELDRVLSHHNEGAQALATERRVRYIMEGYAQSLLDQHTAPDKPRALVRDLIDAGYLN